MKIRLTLTSLLAAAVFCAAAPAAHAQIKVATVDMNKVFSGYYKTKDAENKINDAREVAKKELDERMESHKVMLDEINQLNKDIDNPAMSPTSQEATAARNATTRSRRCVTWNRKSRSSRAAARSSSRSRRCGCATRSSRRS